MSNAIHNAVQQLSESVAKEFPDADYLIAVKFDQTGRPSVTVYAGAGLSPVQTDLTGVEDYHGGRYNLSRDTVVPWARHREHL